MAGGRHFRSASRLRMMRLLQKLREMTMSTKTANRRPNGQGIKDLGQVVLVLQGGGALGAYQIGVYQALHEAGIEPDWVLGTSIGAINASLIAGNAPEHRLE